MIDCGCHSVLLVCKGGLIPLKFMDLTLVSFKFTCLFVLCISSVAPCCILYEHSYLPSCFASSSVFCMNDSHYHKCSTSQTYWVCSLFFGASCFLYVVVMAGEWLLGAYIGEKYPWVKWCVLYILSSIIDPLAQMTIRALLSMYLLIIWSIFCHLVDASVAWWWRGRLLRQERLWCLISCCVVWWSLPCGRPWHDILSMLLHSYMSERCLWGSIHISSMSRRIPLCDGVIHNHLKVEQPALMTHFAL